MELTEVVQMGRTTVTGNSVGSVCYRGKNFVASIARRGMPVATMLLTDYHLTVGCTR